MSESIDVPKITIITPTFNRDQTLPRLYDSLSKQTFKDFEWVIVDDGSTDGTASLVKTWRESQNSFPIHYLWQENRGKHVALNVGVRKAKGGYCAVIDSDDWYPETALSDLLQVWESIPDNVRSEYANVEGLSTYADGTLIGSTFPEDVYDSDNFQILRERDKFGDTHGMYRTEVLKAFPFPEEFPFVGEGLVWNRIAEKYKTRFVNKVTGFKEYLTEGLTKAPLKDKIRRGECHILYSQELLRMKRELTPEQKKKAVLTIISMGLHHHKNLLELYANTNEKMLFICLFPLGLSLFLRQKVKMFRDSLWARRRSLAQGSS